jgi:arginase
VDRPVTAAIVDIRCRTSDRTPRAGVGAQLLAELAAERIGVAPRVIGSPGEPRTAPFADDLRDSRGCLLEAGGQVDDALEAGAVPLVFAAECSIGLTTLSAALRHVPGARVLWLDAHGDFNTPGTSPSEYLGGMALAGACGLWDAGLGGAIPAERAVLAGVRDLDGPERELLERSAVTVVGASPVETLVAVKNALDGAPVYVHLDLDVIDPEWMPAQFPAPGGLAPEKLFDLLEAVAGDCQVVGAEVTAFEAPEDAASRESSARTALGAIEPLLDAVASSAGVTG